MRIGVLPAPEAARRGRLLQALEQAFPVSFEPRPRDNWREIDAAIVFGTGEELPGTEVEVFVAPGTGEQRESEAAAVRFAEVPQVPEELRGRMLTDSSIPAATAFEARGALTLAEAEHGALWAREESGRVAVTRIAAPIDELGHDETLRDHVRPGRFLGLVALVHFLRGVSAGLAWQPPPLRACFLFDDPNLHWPTYGYLGFDELAREAERGGFHVAMATVPLDAWFAHPRAAELFRDRPRQLSLVVHGNDHVKRELARPTQRREAAMLSTQALRRIERLERRARVRVERVMVPPHGACAEVTARALVGAGFEALCVSRPYPWLPRPPANRPLAGWAPGDIVADGLPVVGRYPLTETVDELPLRAFLGQPLISYGHHGDVADGIDLLVQRSAFINGLGTVRWMSPGEIVRSNVETRRDGARLRVRPFARHVGVSIPEEVRELVVELPPGFDDEDHAVVRLASGEPVSAAGDDAEPAFAVPGGAEVKISIGAEWARVEPSSRLRPRPWPLLRRVLVEGRDRALPLTTRRRSAS